MPYNENLSSQVVDYKCVKYGKFSHDSSSCMGKKKTFGEVLVTNYDEIYHRNEPTLGCELSSSITCQRCGVNGKNSCSRMENFGELFESSQNYCNPQRLDHSSQGYAQKPQPLHSDPFHSLPPLSLFEQLMAKMDEHDRKMDDRLERLKKHDNSFDKTSKSSSIFPNFVWDMRQT